MTSDLPDMIIGGKGELAGAIPHLLGYRPDEQSVVVLGLQGNRLGPLAATTSPAHDGFTSHVSAGFARQVGQAFTVTASPRRSSVTAADGPGRARLVAEALDSYVSPNHEVACWSVDRGQVRSWDRPGAGRSLSSVDSGAECCEALRRDSRHDMVDSVQPQRRRRRARRCRRTSSSELGGFLEADQVGLARDVVRQLTELGGRGPREYAWLGALINGPSVVRDAVLGATVTSPGGVEARGPLLLGPECTGWADRGDCGHRLRARPLLRAGARTGRPSESDWTTRPAGRTGTSLPEHGVGSQRASAGHSRSRPRRRRLLPLQPHAISRHPRPGYPSTRETGRIPQPQPRSRAMNKEEPADDRALGNTTA